MRKKTIITIIGTLMIICSLYFIGVLYYGRSLVTSWEEPGKSVLALFIAITIVAGIIVSCAFEIDEDL